MRGCYQPLASGCQCGQAPSEAPEPESWPSSPWQVRLLEWGLPLGLCLLGLLLAHYPMLLTGFARVQTDRIDTRLNNFILEHGYLWLRGVPGHRDFWSPAVFYPAQNTFAYSEILLSVAPFYWVWRWLGLPADTAFQLWILTMGGLNFAAAYLPLRLGARLSPLAAGMGAFLFAFGAPHLAHLSRQQLLAEFYTPLAVFALIMALRRHLEGCPRLRTAPWIFLFGGSVVGQLYACYYLGWFLMLGLALAAGWALMLRDYRRILLSFVWAHLMALLVTATVSAWILAPMVNHYLQARFDVPRRHYMDAYFSMPSWEAWLFNGQQSWCYGWTAPWFKQKITSIFESEPIGIGLATPVLVGMGLWQARERPWVRLLALVLLTALLYTITLAHERTLCKLQFNLIPGAYAIRACHRVVFMLLVPLSVGLALAVQRLQGRKPAWLLLPLLGFCILEQGRSIPSYDKYQARAETAALAQRVDPNCNVFFLTPTAGDTARYNVDALWVHVLTGLPTVNGHSGNQPPNWPFLDMPVNTPAQRKKVEKALDLWLREAGTPDRKICWVQIPGP